MPFNRRPTTCFTIEVQTLTLGPGYNEKKYVVVLSDFIYLVIVTEQITYIEDTCYQAFYLLIHYNRVRAVADPGFPVGGAPTRWGGRQPPTRTLFGKNVCENERN